MIVLMTKNISTHSETSRQLKENNLHAKKKFGQNFIIDTSVVEKIARLSLSEHQIVIEVGPGLGALTQQLALYAKHVVAYEIDPDCVKLLNDSFTDGKVEIIQQDFLTVTSEEVEKTGASVLVGNLPYYITTPILFHVLEDLSSVKIITIMVQKEVADRFTAKPSTKDYNALSVIIQTLCEAKVIMKVKPHVFLPQPTVDSSVVQLIRKDSKQDMKPFFAFVKLAFTQRRKTLINNLKSIPDIESHLTALGHRSDIRAEAISPSEWLTLYARIYENQSSR
jgi:16S rRNA (adenine1518-N6/adenine1519-N6)-dimethyltransferase